MEVSIERFITAQDEDGTYARALAELRAGHKESHWIWYIFPQLRCLGRSVNAKYYGIADENEARAYCANKTLRARYVECCRALLACEKKDVREIMGSIDSIKLCSSLTLFYAVDEKNRPLYKKLLDKFYQGAFDNATVQFLREH